MRVDSHNDQRHEFTVEELASVRSRIRAAIGPDIPVDFWPPSRKREFYIDCGGVYLAMVYRHVAAMVVYEVDPNVRSNDEPESFANLDRAVDRVIELLRSKV